MDWTLREQIFAAAYVLVGIGLLLGYAIPGFRKASQKTSPLSLQGQEFLQETPSPDSVGAR